MSGKRQCRPEFRKLAAAAGALSVLSLAGCSAEEPGSMADGVDHPGPTDIAGNGGELSGERDRPVGAPCDDGSMAGLEDERFELTQQLEELEYQLRSLRDGARATEFLLDQLDPGFSDETLQHGRAVGLSVRPSVVMLEVLHGDVRSGHASAWFVDENHLFTNAHNVHPSGPDTTFRCRTSDGDRFGVEVVDLYEGMTPDIALLRTDYTSTEPLPLTDPDELAVGQPLVQVGHPEEVGFWIISMGRFVAGTPSLSPDGIDYTGLKSVVPGRPGVSGSPLLTLNGDVVGMTHGGEPVGPHRSLGTPPPVAPDVVFDGPIGDVAVALHAGSDILRQKLEDWR